MPAIVTEGRPGVARLGFVARGCTASAVLEKAPIG